MMKEIIKNYCDNLIQDFELISDERKVLLEKISDYVNTKISTNQLVNLIYVCTHNSRRSHFGQVWAKVAADYYGIKNVKTFSGGTEATAFNINAINALKRVGFEISASDNSTNPKYNIDYQGNDTIVCFSKVYNDEVNPKENFAAVMTCNDADENCPFIPGVELRIGTTYNDPKAFDNTELQDEKYSERCNQIATECLYVFSKVNK